MSTMMVPATRPKLTEVELLERIKPFGIDRAKYPLVCVGIRGYYRDTMGQPGVNDRGIYDDAICLHSASAYATFNGNTDPSKAAPGMAVLDPGCYYAHTFDLHRGRYLALCQRAGQVSVTRDGGQRRQLGYFGINIHCGGHETTGSEGCQTIHPDQWDSFIGLATGEAKRYHGATYETWRAKVVPYILLTT